MPWARLELALRLSPNWILSPTRLPIPPPGQAYIKFSITLWRFGRRRLRSPPISVLNLDRSPCHQGRHILNFKTLWRFGRRRLHSPPISVLNLDRSPCHQGRHILSFKTLRHLVRWHLHSHLISAHNLDRRHCHRGGC